MGRNVNRQTRHVSKQTNAVSAALIANLCEESFESEPLLVLLTSFIAS